MRKANAMGLAIGGLVVGGAVVAAVVVGNKKKAQAAAPSQLPAGQPGAQAMPALYPVPPIPEVPGAQPADTAVQQQVVAAIQTGNPAQMRATAAQLRQQGYTQAASTLEAYAASQETAANVVQGAMNTVANVLAQPVPAQAPPVATQPLPGTIPQPPPIPTSPPPAAPPVATPAPMPTVATPGAQAPAGTTPVTIPGIPGLTQPVTYNVPTELTQLIPPGLIPGTAPAPAPTPAPAPVTTGEPVWPEQDPAKRSVAQSMNINIAANAKGRENQSLVKQFQTQEAGKAGTVDGKYGPTVAKDLGERYGIIPARPLYWSSKSPEQGQKDAYNGWLSDMAVKDPVRVEQWGAAAVF